MLFQFSLCRGASACLPWGKSHPCEVPPPHRQPLAGRSMSPAKLMPRPLRGHREPSPHTESLSSFSQAMGRAEEPDIGRHTLPGPATACLGSGLEDQVTQLSSHGTESAGQGYLGVQHRRLGLLQPQSCCQHANSFHHHLLSQLSPHAIHPESFSPAHMPQMSQNALGLGLMPTKQCREYEPCTCDRCGRGWSGKPLTYRLPWMDEVQHICS